MKYTLLLLTLFLCITTQAQNHKSEKDDTARIEKHDPEEDYERIEHSNEKNVYANTHSSWYKQMMKRRPNIKKAEAAFKKYFQAHPDKESSLKDRFNSWVEQARLYMDRRGYALPMPATDRSDTAATGVPGLTSTSNNTFGTWAMIGPANMVPDQCNNNNMVTGGYCDRVYVNPYNTNNLFAGFSNGGLWVSTDQGSTWLLTDGSFANGTNTYPNRDYYYGQIKANPLNSSLVFAATEAGLLKSVNGGVNWTLCPTLNRNSSSSLRPYYISQAVNDQTTMLSTFGQKVYRSTDAGATWTMVFDNSGGGRNHTFTSQYNFNTPFGLNDRTYNFFGLEADYSNPGHYYLGVWNSSNQACIYQSTDGGATFSLLANLNTLLNTAWGAGTTLCLKTIPSSPSRFFVYEQFATNKPYYKFTSSGTLLESNTINTYTEAFDIDWTHENTLYQGQYGVYNSVSGFQRSTDEGTTFNPPSSLASGVCNYLHADIRGVSAVGNVVLIGNDGGIGLSLDSGATIVGTGFNINSMEMWGFSSSRKSDICITGLDHNQTFLRRNSGAGGWTSQGGADALVCMVNPYNDSWVYYNSGYSIIRKGYLNADGSLTATPASALPDLGSLEFDSYLTGNVYGIQDSNDSTIVHSTDNLSTATPFYKFGSPVTAIRIARRDPRTMYVLLNQSIIQRSSDSGATWVSITPPASVSGGQTNITAIDVGKTPGELWAAYGNAQNTAKVLHSTDGGNTWTNITTSNLPAAAVSNIAYQRGTNGGVYISIITGAGTTVWYRNNTMATWQQLGNTLPLMGYIKGKLYVVPAAGKLRFGSSRGAWESPLYEPSIAEAGIAADTRSYGCGHADDSIQFYDASAYAPGTVSYSWQFPGGSPATSTLANPKVSFPTPGTHPVTLTVTTPAGSDTVTIQNFTYLDSTLCWMGAPTDTVAGTMLDLTPSGDPVVSLSPIPLNSNRFTITFWAKPQGLQKVFTQMISSNTPNSYFGIGFAFPGYTDNLNLVFTSNSVAYQQLTNINLDTTRWNHIALTYTPDSVSLYLNGGAPWTFPKSSSSTPSGFPAIDFSKAPVTVNEDIHGQGGNYKGYIDEISFYNYALSQQQIREKMHLTKMPASEPGLVGYYQFNQYNSNSQLLFDAMGYQFPSQVPAANITPSTAPVASGTSFRIPNVTAPGDYTFTGTGATLHFPGPVVPNGEMVVTRLNSLPDSLPAGYTSPGAPYWIIHNWGTNTSFTPMTTLQLSAPGINAVNPATLWHYVHRLWTRDPNGFRNPWSLSGGATAAVSATPGNVTFNTAGITSEGQLFVSSVLTSPQADTVAGKMLDLTPSGNPVISLSPMPLNSNTFTITFWAKPQGLQKVFTQMISSNTPNSYFGIGFGFPGYNDNLKLTFSSNSAPYQLYSNINLDTTRWNHIALTYTPDSVTLYLNGGTPWTFPASSSSTPSGFPAIDFSKAPVTVNADIHNQGGNYKGYIDELCFFNYALSQQQIREKMHLTKVPGSETGLVGYYQFNQYNSSTDTLYDAMGNGNASAVPATNITPSTAPVASGTSFRIPNVTGPGDYTFTGTGATLHFPGPVVPNGEMVVSRLNSLPDSLPAGYASPGAPYWIIHNWGTNAAFTPMTTLQLPAPGNTSSQNILRLWMRDPNAFLTNWTQLGGAAVTAGTPGNVSFDTAGITSEGQLYITSGNRVLSNGTTAPQADTVAGRMLDLTPSGNPVVSLSPVPLNSNRFTITLWAKPQGLQKVFTQMISSNAPNSYFGIGFGFPGYNDNLKLTFSSNSAPYQLYSNINMDSTRWNHIALTYTPDSVTLYLNGGAPWTFPASSSSTPSGFPAIDFSKAPVTVNADIHNQGGNYKGYIDELCFFNYALSQQQIREKMHLTKVPGSETGLVGYYQFNQYNSSTDTLYDAMGNGNASAVPATNITPSTAPVASGTSFRIPNVTGPGNYTFTGTGVTLRFPGPLFPNGEMVVSRLNSLPDSLPATYSTPGAQYWIIHNWGSNASFTPMTNLQFSAPGINPVSTSPSNTLPQLWMRDPNAFRNTWVLQCNAAAATAASTDTATFNGCNITTVGQFYTMVPIPPMILKNKKDSATGNSFTMQGPDDGKFIRLIPNPVKDNEPVILQNLGRSEAQVDLYLTDGRHYRHYTVAPAGTVLIPHLPKGSVFYHATNKDGQKASGVEIVQ